MNMVQHQLEKMRSYPYIIPNEYIVAQLQILDKLHQNAYATVQDIPLGFVPATFDEQDPNWAENRSKHRNDPITMKKLKGEAASKSKKSTSKEDKIDEQQQSQEDGSNKQERPHNEDMQHENYAKGSINDMEVSRDEESNKHHILEEQQLLDVNAANKDAGHEDDFENKDCSDLEALEDVNLTAKEDVDEVKLKNQESTDVTDGQDEIGGTVTDSIQAAVDTILFGLSTPLITKSMDVGASSKMTERHWDLPYSQIPPDFPHAQVRELQASKVNAPAKRERKKSRVLRSSYISKYGSGSKDSVDFDKEEKLKYAFDGYTINQDLPNELMIDYFQWIAVGLLKTHSSKKETDNHYRVNASGLGYSQLDFVVAYPQSKNWFYLRDCGMFVCAYAKILSEGLQVHSCQFDASSQRARYASLLWHYGVEKANEGYTSDNGDPPRPNKSVIEEIEASAIVTLE
ncbi:hypothetical protein BC332_02922 [Capsicum chinense]|nr:hypothetical protein BC332_02922 [Capsicum chinense]